jgi:hypothetical protein
MTRLRPQGLPSQNLGFSMQSSGARSLSQRPSVSGLHASSSSQQNLLAKTSAQDNSNQAAGLQQLTNASTSNRVVDRASGNRLRDLQRIMKGGQRASAESPSENESELEEILKSRKQGTVIQNTVKLFGSTRTDNASQKTCIHNDNTKRDFDTLMPSFDNYPVVEVGSCEKYNVTIEKVCDLFVTAVRKGCDPECDGKLPSTSFPVS